MTESERPPEPPPDDAPDGDPADGQSTLPTARVTRRERWSLVWLLPILALAVGGWLVVKTLAERGPTITIEFPNAGGLQAGKTKVKYKDVDIGTVTDIAVSDDLQYVTVTAELRHGTDHMLAEDTEFWIARPLITASQISGLETLLSGPYVALAPGTGKLGRRDFKGLDKPPVVTINAPGRRFRLRASSLGSLNLGTPVYYRGIQVGQVVNYNIDKDGKRLTIDIFIQSPNDGLIFKTTRFWNASGIDVKVGVDGVTVDTESLMSVLIGGIAFETPAEPEHPPRAPPKQFFNLFPNRAAAMKEPEFNRLTYVMVFQQSVRGLKVGAPVSLRGIKIGEVTDINLEFEAQQIKILIPVTVEINPDRLGLRRPLEEIRSENPELLKDLIQRGLRAQLKPENLLTGALYIDLDFHQNAPPATEYERDGVPVIPTLPTPLEAATNRIMDILDKIDALPIEEIGDDLRGTLAGTRAIADSRELRSAIADLSAVLTEIRTLTQGLNATVMPEMGPLLRDAQRTLNSANGALSSVQDLVAPDAPASTELVSAMQEVTGAARAVRLLAEYLERHPEALIQGKGGGR
ncbi:MAG: MlaD family protein [Thiohalocapsa sp.]|uniref:PqiB family protein n=1 Tax=Thiohalocapsa sp. TaxID=2497641 RepID=UPI0025EAA07B|nr:MlaD family protein [Thiohalocapsa sp.]MCG6941040.1 MlaD family protein [Thiohalocapsa sp.]